MTITYRGVEKLSHHGIDSEAVNARCILPPFRRRQSHNPTGIMIMEGNGKYGKYVLHSSHALAPTFPCKPNCPGSRLLL